MNGIISELLNQVYHTAPGPKTKNKQKTKLKIEKKNKNKMWLVILGLVVVVFNTWNVFAKGKYKIVFMRPKLITLGTLAVNEITLLEFKPLFSLKTFYFNPGIAQEIFHTHSFSAYSLLLYGNYIESFCDPLTESYWTEQRNRSRLIYISKDIFHQITNSEGCRTIMLTGPWGDTYQEYKPETHEIITSTRGRQEISRVKK